MSLRVAAFVDHEIGYRLLDKMTSEPMVQRMRTCAVITTRENGGAWWPGVEQLCRERGLPLFRYDDEFDVDMLPEPVDVALLLSWKHLVPESIYSWPEMGAINLHYSLLPELRGVYPVNWALIEGRQTTGVTFHRVDARIDRGDILLQRQIHISGHDTSRSLQLRLDDVAFELFDELPEALSTRPCGIAQDPARGSYRSRKDFEAAREIDPDRLYQGRELINLLRGMTFLPGTRNAFFREPLTGRRIFLNLDLSPE